MKMKNILTVSLMAIILTGTLLIPGCKKSTEADASYVLTVQVDNGANGTPTTGTYTYKKDDRVAYGYTLKQAYKNLKVTLDAATVENSGTITISGNHTLYVVTEPEAAAFSLTVSVAPGIEGTPASGISYYLPNTQVPYSYSVMENYIDLKVTLDGATIANSGAITILKNSTLNVSATLHYDIQGAWSLTEAYSDGSSFNSILTFAGTSTAGTVTDSDGGIGTFTVQGTYITFKLDFPNVKYEYTGLFADKNNTSGTAKRIIVATGAISGGSWRGVRNTTALSTLSTTGDSTNNKNETGVH